MHRSSIPPGPKISRIVGLAESPRCETGTSRESKSFSIPGISREGTAYPGLGRGSSSSGSYERSRAGCPEFTWGSTESTADLRRFTKTHLLPESSIGFGFHRKLNDSTVVHRRIASAVLPAVRSDSVRICAESLVVEHSGPLAGNPATLSSVTVLVGEFPALCPACSFFKFVVGCK